jgi:hypothetical protein
LDLQDAGNDEQQIFRDLRRLAIRALRETRDLWQEQLERLSQAGSIEDDVHAPATAVHSLENDDGGVTECSICLVEFVDGGQVSAVADPN